ncbi:hypothetical protein M758_UG036500 [Ceratodon purpureus]|nr:hypothetical protein M758_UG036500 [Ceratodon purpureus]
MRETIYKLEMSSTIWALAALYPSMTKRFKYRFCQTQAIWKQSILLFWERLVRSSFSLETPKDLKTWAFYFTEMLHLVAWV